MRVAKKKKHGDPNLATPAMNGKPSSVRHLKAFGIWADRKAAKDAVQFTKHIRTRMERGNDAG